MVERVHGALSSKWLPEWSRLRVHRDEVGNISRRKVLRSKEGLKSQNTKFKRYILGDVLLLGCNVLFTKSGLWLNTTLDPLAPEFVSIEGKMELLRL